MRRLEAAPARAGIGLYPLGALLNHGCRPTATQTFVGRVIRFRALRDLPAGMQARPALTLNLSLAEELRSNVCPSAAACAKLCSLVLSRRRLVSRLAQNDGAPLAYHPYQVRVGAVVSCRWQYWLYGHGVQCCRWVCACSWQLRSHTVQLCLSRLDGRTLATPSPTYACAAANV